MGTLPFDCLSLQGGAVIASRASGVAIQKFVPRLTLHWWIAASLPRRCRASLAMTAPPRNDGIVGQRVVVPLVPQSNCSGGQQ